MGFHTYDVERADALEDQSRYEFLSVDELLALLDPNPEDVVADLGSGTGFYTDDVARYVDSVLGLDVQPAMHDKYRSKGLPPNARLVTAEAGTLPFRDGTLDAVVSTMTYHEFASETALEEVGRILESGGRVAIADWTTTGAGNDGPPLDERYGVADAVDHFESAGFEIERAQDRRETFVLVART